MFSFFKKNIEPAGLFDFSGMAMDIHCHLLPGIDDGSPDVETSLDLLRQLMAAGISRFICTPHVIGDLYRNTPETIHNALLLLKNACEANHMEVELSAAAEYMLDDYFMELMHSKAPLLTLKKNYLLTELSYATAPGNLEKFAFEMNIAGYQPLMAHPERYFYYHKNYAIYQRMKDLGFLLQVNLLSLTGYYGKAAAKAARYIITNNLHDFIGTDLHHANHLQALTNPQSREIFQQYLGNRVFNTFE